MADVAPEVLAAPRVVRRAGPLLDRAGERPLGRGVAGAAARLRRRGRPAGGASPARPPSTTGTRLGERCHEQRTPLRPATLYGAAKHALHTVAARYAEQAGFELAWGRIFFVYGPGEPDGRLVPSVGRALLAGEPVPTTRGDQVRDFMHVEDVAARVRRARGQRRSRER